MLKRLDRILLAVRDRQAAADTFTELFDARRVRDDASRLLGAHRTVVQAGTCEFELLEANGDGSIARHIDRWGEGIFAAGFASDRLEDLAGRLSGQGVDFAEDGERLFISADHTPGMNVVLSPDGEREPVGLISWLYEVTNLVEDHDRAAAFYADTFGLDSSRFSPITSERYGYIGTLTLFNPPDQLDRIEVVQITDPSLAMGRFYARRGPGIYMGYVETDDVAAVQRRLEARGSRYAGRSDDPEPEGLFIHPTALHGMLMGVSRTNLAWSWSGRPELAKR